MVARRDHNHEPEDNEMKWTMISVAAMGLATYGVIFLAQLQHRTEAETAPATVESTPPETVSIEPATLEPVAVSDPATVAGGCEGLRRPER